MFVFLFNFGKNYQEHGEDSNYVGYGQWFLPGGAIERISLSGKDFVERISALNFHFWNTITQKYITLQ